MAGYEKRVRRFTIVVVLVQEFLVLGFLKRKW